MFTSRTLLRAATCLFMTSGALSCGPTGAYSGSAVAPRNEAAVTVTNHNWADIKVYVVRGGSKFRLGSVTSFTTTRLRIPGVVSGAADFRLRVELIGSSVSYTTEIVRLGHGDQIDLMINTYLPLSNIAIR